jgi:ComEC/Rec2-related protein
MAIGLWSASILRPAGSEWVWMLWLLLGPLAVVLEPRAWKNCLGFIILGWCCMAWIESDNQKFAGHSPSTSSWLDHGVAVPCYIPSARRDSLQKRGGPWWLFAHHCLPKKVWMSLPSDMALAPRRGWFQWRMPHRFDLADAFPFEDYLDQQGMDGTASLISSSPLEDETTMVDRTRQFALGWRSWVDRRTRGNANGLLLGVFAGDRHAVSPEIRQAFAAIGLGHLLSVSGYHVGLVGLFFLVLLRSQHRMVRRTSVLGVLATAAFVMACGHPTSAIRAWIMLLCLWWSVARGQRPSPWHALGMAACVVTLLDSNVPRQLGAQLSFVATASLLALRGRWMAWRVPFRAQWATLPWTTSTFEAFPILFYPTNIVAGPAMWCLGILFGLGCLGWTGSMTSACWIADALGEASEGSTSAPWVTLSHQPWSNLTGRLCILGLGGLWLIRLVRGADRRRTVRAAWAGSVCLAMVVTILQANMDSKLRLWHLKGRSNCFLLEDGHRSEAWWEHPMDSVRAVHVVRSLSLAGRMEMHRGLWGNTVPWKDAQTKWTQPPEEVWVHERTVGMASHQVYEKPIN